MRPAIAVAAAVAGLTRCVRTFGALAVLEIPVGGGDAALARLAAVAVAAGAHRAAGLAPEEAGVAEHPVEALGLGLALHRRRAGHHHGDHAVGDRRPRTTSAATCRSGSRALVQEPMNTRFTGRPASAMPGGKSHVGERAFDRRLAALVGGGGRIGHAVGDAEHHARVGAPGDLRLERRRSRARPRGRTPRRHPSCSVRQCASARSHIAPCGA